MAEIKAYTIRKKGTDLFYHSTNDNDWTIVEKDYPNVIYDDRTYKGFQCALYGFPEDAEFIEVTIVIK